MTRVLGSSGPAVLLLPGGAEAVEGFFPGLPEALVADPGCRLVLHDRRGTGANPEPGALADAAGDLHATIARLGTGPVVVVGQSLGGAAALLLAQEHPEDVAGLVLLDPSPLSDPAQAVALEREMDRILRLSRLPLVGAGLRLMLRASTLAMTRRHRMDAAHRAAALRTSGLDFAGLGRAVLGFAELALTFDAARLSGIPAVVVTADRPDDHPIHRVHARLAEALGAPLVSWPGAEHGVHLTHPTEVLGATRELLGRVAAA